jgi:hypothetical protein
MRQSGDGTGPGPLDADGVRRLLREAVERLDVDRARSEVAPFVRDRRALEAWSPEFFLDVVGRFTQEG